MIDWDGPEPGFAIRASRAVGFVFASVGRLPSRGGQE